jgi:hypothetical protein
MLDGWCFFLWSLKTGSGAMAADKSFKIKVEIRADNNASATLQAVSGGLGSVTTGMDAVKQAAAGVDVTMDETMRSLVPPNVEAQLDAVTASVLKTAEAVKGLGSGGLGNLEAELKQLAAATDNFDRSIGGVGRLQDELYGVDQTAEKAMSTIRNAANVRFDPATKSIAELRAELRQTMDLMEHVPVGSDMFAHLTREAGQLKGQLMSVEAQMVQTARATESKLGSSVKGSTMILQDMGRVISDLPYGFIGIANNLSPLAEGFTRVSRDAGGSGAAISMMLAELAGPAGLAMIGIPIVSALAVMFGDDLVRAVMSGGESIDDLRKKLDGIQQYKDFDMTVRIAGLDGIAKLNVMLDQALAKKAFLEGTDRVDKEVERYNDPNWIVGMTNPLAYGMMTNGRAEMQNKAKAEADAFRRGYAVRIAAGKLTLGGEYDVELLRKYQGMSKSDAERLLARTETNLEVESLRSQIEGENAKDAAKGAKVSKGSRSSGIKVSDDFAKVLESLDDERKKLTMTTSEYKAYQMIKRAGVAEGSQQAEVIRSEVESLDKLGQSYKDDAEAADWFMKHGSDAMDSVKSRTDQLLTAMDDGFQSWSGSFEYMLNDLVWSADKSFGDILQSFGEMITQMMIKSQIAQPLTSGVSSFLQSLMGGSSVPVWDNGGAQAVDLSSYLNVPAFASGGVVRASGGGSVVRVAEAGQDEAIIPLKNGAVPVDWRGGSRVSTPSVMRVEVINPPGVPLRAEVSQSVDVDGIVTRIVLSDIASSGPIRQAVAAVAQGGA